MVLNAEEKSTYNTNRSLRVSPASSITCSRFWIWRSVFLYRRNPSCASLNSASSGAMSPSDGDGNKAGPEFVHGVGQSDGSFILQEEGVAGLRQEYRNGFCPGSWRVGLDPHDFHEVVDGGLECVVQCL
jgi:hypothetical protein